MRTYFSFFLGLAAFCLILAGAAAADESALSVASGTLIVKNNVVYVTRDGVELKGNLYRPSKPGLVPGIVLAHGGGFVAGDKDHYNIPEIASYIASGGYAVFSVNYRLLQQGGLFPGNAQDVKCAIRWLRAHAAENGIDTSLVAVMGNSAGGYMASFDSVTQHDAEFNAPCGDPALDSIAPEVDLAVEWYGVHDMATLKGNLVSTMEKMYFSKVKDKAEFKKRISPLTYAAQAPPTLMLHGTADMLVPVGQSRTMCAAITAAGGDCTLVEFPDTGHGFIDEKFGTENSVKALKMTVEWFDKQFPAVAARKAKAAK